MKTITNVIYHAVALFAFASFAAIPGTGYGQVQGGDLFSTVNLGGTYNNGASPLYQYTPQYIPPNGTPSIFASALDTPRGLAFDSSSGTLYVATNTTVDASVDPPTIQGTILQITPGGLMTTFATGFPVDFVQGLATDSAGNVFVTTQHSDQSQPSTIYKITPNPPNAPTIREFASLPFAGWGLTCDSAGNVYAATGGHNSVVGEIREFDSHGTEVTYPLPEGGPHFLGPEAFSAPRVPVGLAFDKASPPNLFVSTEDSNTGDGDIREFDSMRKEVLSGNPPSHFAPELPKTPRGLAFDSAGNLFVAEPGIPGRTDADAIGDILTFTPDGTMTPFASQNFGTKGNRGPEWLAFTTGAVTPPTTAVTFTLPDATGPSTAAVTSIDQNSVPPPPSNFELSGINLAFDISTTTTPTPPIIIAFTVPSSAFNSQLKAMHYECPPPAGVPVDNSGCGWVDRTIYPTASAYALTGPLDPGYPSNPAPDTIYGSVNSLSPFLIAKFKFKAQVQPPIKANGTSVFKRGVVVAVKFTLTSDGAATCQLPPATISLIGTAGTILSGKSFRIDSTSCQYVYNLATSSLSTGTYQVNILIGGSLAGSATFGLK